MNGYLIKQKMHFVNIAHMLTQNAFCKCAQKNSFYKYRTHAYNIDFHLMSHYTEWRRHIAVWRWCRNSPHDIGIVTRYNYLKMQVIISYRNKIYNCTVYIQLYMYIIHVYYTCILYMYNIHVYYMCILYMYIIHV